MVACWWFNEIHLPTRESKKAVWVSSSTKVLSGLSTFPNGLVLVPLEATAVSKSWSMVLLKVC